MTPEEQDAVRRALAATPPEGPMPPEVVARLEATIAQLAAVRPESPATDRPPTDGSASGVADGSASGVVDLEERRRRRWPRVLVAAASVAVLAYGVGAVLPDLGMQAETAMDSAGGQAAEDSEAEGGGSTGGAAPQEEEPQPQSAPESVRAGRVVLLQESTLRRDVERHLASEPVAALADGPADRDGAARYTRRDGTCVAPEVRGGDELHPARLDGTRATLVVRAARGGSRVAQVYWCGDGRTLLAQTEVPARR